jgi:hypothetical protein
MNQVVQWAKSNPILAGGLVIVALGGGFLILRQNGGGAAPVVYANTGPSPEAIQAGLSAQNAQLQAQARSEELNIQRDITLAQTGAQERVALATLASNREIEQLRISGALSSAQAQAAAQRDTVAIQAQFDLARISAEGATRLAVEKENAALARDNIAAQLQGAKFNYDLAVHEVISNIIVARDAQFIQREIALDAQARQSDLATHQTNINRELAILENKNATNLAFRDQRNQRKNADQAFIGGLVGTAASFVTGGGLSQISRIGWPATQPRLQGAEGVVELEALRCRCLRPGH